ncbi:hypothetical protein POTG_01729 [Paenibacillus sp. oral taxon 786 str. D14]|nr:hypothetical protein POTG_01729 [Paenibacillus sp. oral taxon 786 str. D14]
MVSYRAIRGYNSARNWNYNTSSNRNDNIGWRPALLVVRPVRLRLHRRVLENFKGEPILHRKV